MPRRLRISPLPPLGVTGVVWRGGDREERARRRALVRTLDPRRDERRELDRRADALEHARWRHRQRECAGVERLQTQQQSGRGARSRGDAISVGRFRTLVVTRGRFLCDLSARHSIRRAPPRGRMRLSAVLTLCEERVRSLCCDAKGSSRLDRFEGFRDDPSSRESNCPTGGGSSWTFFS